MQIRTRRAYEKPTDRDGLRVLVDRVWPRGVSKAEAKLDLWLKEIAPSTELRKWFGHDPEKWEEFKERYCEELRSGEQAEAVDELLGKAKDRRITLVYGASETRYNNAEALKEYLSAREPPAGDARGSRRR